ncbi:MAG: HDOD domain-containing protein [Sedimenticola sp.]|nr:HDOD domain-containing protein [Sedimenticola sp.]
MAHAIRSWIDRLSTKSLPAMALTRKRVPQLLDSPNSNNADLQRIISRDPGFSLAIYRAFSTLPHPPKEPITNIAHAIALLGIEPMTKACDQLPVLNLFLKGTARTALLDCYSRAGHAAWYALNWGQQLHLNNPEEMAVAALLSELGEMMLWSHAEQEMTQIIALERRGMRRSVAEQTILGFELNDLSLQLAERWKLPALLIDALNPSGAFQTRSLAVMLAAAMAKESGYNWCSEEMQELIELSAELNGTGLDQGRAEMHSLAAGAARNLNGLPVPLTALALLQPRPLPTVKVEQQKIVVTATEETQQTPASGIAAIRKKPEIDEKMDADTVPVNPKQSVKPDSNTISSPTANLLQERLDRLFRDLRESTGVDRIMFAMLSADGAQLQAKYTVSTATSSSLRQFKHPVGERHLLTLMMKKPQGIWLNRENQGKLSPLMSEQTRAALDTRGFYMSSLFINNLPMGLLYADRSDPEFLDKHGFSQFKSLTQRLCNELGQK